MGKAGILEGGKGDIMILDVYVFEGIVDNYFIENELSLEDFQGRGLCVFFGLMIIVMGILF